MKFMQTNLTHVKRASNFLYKVKNYSEDNTSRSVFDFHAKLLYCGKLSLDTFNLFSLLLTFKF